MLLQHIAVLSADWKGDMGYYTSFELEVARATAVKQNIPVDFEYLDDDERRMAIALVREHENEKLSENVKYALDEDGNTYGSTKWYDCTGDMIALTAGNDKYIYAITGAGEESGDIWVKAFFDGKMIYSWKLDFTTPKIPGIIASIGASE